jgi:hypothetical protein
VAPPPPALPKSLPRVAVGRVAGRRPVGWGCPRPVLAPCAFFNHKWLMIKADRIDLTTPDMKAELLARLKDVVPEIFVDGELDLQLFP